ncbi:MAG: hypothetical protein NZ895_01300 [Archaeoglobaceae archaeon]|nr:hypothetical protein [Archaeoglobaceae archaeon]MCX8151680.1 hypothetical protein [Archaeoglobaceae archaeon]MDW8013042.1 hypothetical protein [Archaeoglobaceae archaeon]
MKVTIELPPDIEKVLVEKCKEKGLSPEQFIYSLIEWYFKRQKSESEFFRVAKEVAEEKVKTCKFSDESFCSLKALEDVFSEVKVEPISPYRCLFCVYYVDRRKEKPKKEVDTKVLDIAKLAAKLVVDLYGDRIFYRSKKRSDEEKIEKLLDL